MHIVETHDPEILRLDDDNFIRRLFGFATLIVTAASWPIYMSFEDPDGRTILLFLGGSLFLGIAGLAMMLNSDQYVIDRRLGKVVHYKRMIAWKLAKQYSLSSYLRVEVVHFRRTSYYVQLTAVANSPAISLVLGTELDRTYAVEVAERISEFTGIPAFAGAP